MSICFVDAFIRNNANDPYDPCKLYDCRVYYRDKTRKYTNKHRYELPRPVQRFMNITNRETCETLPDGSLHCTYGRCEK